MNYALSLLRKEILKMAKPFQFHVPEKLREEIEAWAKNNQITISDFLRQSVRFYIIIRNYTDQGYELVLRKKGSEKEIILP